MITRDPQTGQEFEDGAGATTARGVHGGERNTASASNNYDAVKQECNATRIVGSTETLVTAAPAYFMGYYANKDATPSSGTAAIRDAAAISGASTPKHVVDATAGQCPPLKDAVFQNGITVQGSAAATDITIQWRPVA